MKLLLVICSVLAVALAQEPSLSCSYNSYNEVYQCGLSINNPNGLNNFTEIGGIHLEGFSDADVNSIYRSSGTTTNVPQIICQTFPNIIAFDMFASRLTEIDDNAFSGCSKITRLFLDYNRITSVSEYAFSTLHELTFITLEENWLATLPENVFSNQQNLTDLYLSYNSFDNLPSGVFKPLKNLQSLYLYSANLSTINSEWFTENRYLRSLYLADNRITLLVNSFAGMEELRTLDLGWNWINEIPAGTFSNLPNLQSLRLYRNRFTDIQANSFPDLGQLMTLDLSSNPIETVHEDAFAGLENLTTLSLSDCGIRDLNSISFGSLRNLSSLNLNFNDIEDIPPGTFASMPNLNYINLWNNHLKTLRRNSFGTLTALQTIDLDGNIVNALDRAIIDDAANLNTLYFNGNLCASNSFGSFFINRPIFMPMLERCFRNFRYIVDTTTESDGVYSFFEGPHPGIVFRVRSDNEIQIALTPFSFMWVPAVEIFIGSSNNTRSVIRVNEETDVVTVPTPNVIQPNQWNDFRVTWANQNILVFSGNDIYPFMSYTMQYFFPVNFYGLRAVETRATWTVQPIE